MKDKNKISGALFQRALKKIPGGVNSPVRAFRSVGGNPFITKSGNGPTLSTVDGDILIDFVGTWGPAIHGHNHPFIRDAVLEALYQGISFGTPNVYEVEMAERLTDAFPSVEKVRMVNSGTEATMSAIRLARGFTGRDKIVKFTGCYHGHVDSLLVKAGSGALTFGNPDSAGIPQSFARETILLPLNDFEALEVAFRDFSEDIAGVIIEACPANCGLILLEDGFLTRIQSLCRERGSLFILDEVMTGFRLAMGGVQEREGLYPDLTAMGKIIGGGLPVGAFGGRAEIMDYLSPEGPVYQAGTLSGNPLAMAAGIASLKLLEEYRPFEILHEKGLWIKQVILNAAKQKGIPIQVPQVGSMFAILFSDQPVKHYDDVIRTEAHYFKKLFDYALNHGVFLPPSAFETAFISTAHSNAILEKAGEVIERGIMNL